MRFGGAGPAGFRQSRLQFTIIFPMSIKKLGVLDVYALAAGAMISSGLFVLPAVYLLWRGRVERLDSA